VGAGESLFIYIYIYIPSKALQLSFAHKLSVVFLHVYVNYEAEGMYVTSSCNICIH
jgi:hypothetical protein